MPRNKSTIAQIIINLMVDTTIIIVYDYNNNLE